MRMTAMSSKKLREYVKNKCKFSERYSNLAHKYARKGNNHINICVSAIQRGEEIEDAIEN